MKAKPFVKWAGGKSQIINELLSRVPDDYARYLEPFVGGGALLFALEHKKSIINDSNAELINAYKVIRDNPKKLLENLKQHKNDSEYYYKIRQIDPLKISSLQRASRFIYLNRTCFNGLWRVNKKNEFNTPFGKYKNPKIVDQDLLLAVSTFLKDVKIYEGDFKQFLLKNSKKGDFIYFDPPYHPISKYSDFKRYTKDFFGINEQKDLMEVFRTLDKRGCKLLLSNSNSDFIRNIYDGYKIEEVMAKRNINNKGEGRGAIKELLISNYG